jgi:hypothetical protein
MHFAAGHPQGGVVLAHGLRVRGLEQAVDVSLVIVIELYLADTDSSYLCAWASPRN